MVIDKSTSAENTVTFKTLPSCSGWLFLEVVANIPQLTFSHFSWCQVPCMRPSEYVDACELYISGVLGESSFQKKKEVSPSVSWWRFSKIPDWFLFIFCFWTGRFISEVTYWALPVFLICDRPSAGTRISHFHLWKMINWFWWWGERNNLRALGSWVW